MSLVDAPRLQISRSTFNQVQGHLNEFHVAGDLIQGHARINILRGNISPDAFHNSELTLLPPSSLQGGEAIVLGSQQSHMRGCSVARSLHKVLQMLAVPPLLVIALRGEEDKRLARFAETLIRPLQVRSRRLMFLFPPDQVIHCVLRNLGRTTRIASSSSSDLTLLVPLRDRAERAVLYRALSDDAAVHLAEADPPQLISSRTYSSCSSTSTNRCASCWQS
ncbi:hypothetical protein C8F04DRAFT_1274193 [Mycena alexandri]|uniref:Uncharacterized protein n=1 Tax=Mycena alexandri TaxID=1745969 RepID=A0AAD6S771_9AGAR|nr:hypothetical protein C8F04DRAFT_1274193 [Mycena alexandri]